MADLLKLRALSDVALQQVTRRMLAGGSVGTWEREARKVLARAHTAAHIAGTAERLGLKPDSTLLSERRLSRIERSEIRAVVDKQLTYLSGFARDVRGGAMSEAQVLARATLYGGPTRSTYYGARWGDWEIPTRLMPGLQMCIGNCKCDISVSDNGNGTGTLTRKMGGTEYHCTECPPLVGDHPVKRKQVA